jgi:hypothetical protein
MDEASILTGKEGTGNWIGKIIWKQIKALKFLFTIQRILDQ